MKKVHIILLYSSLALVFESDCLFSNKLTNAETIKEKASAASKVMPSAELSKEITFWRQILKEHLEYLALAFKGHKRFNDQGKKLRDELTSFDINQLDRDSKGRYIRLLEKIKRYKEEAKKKVGKNRALAALIDHMLEELDYHRNSIEGVSRTASSEKAFLKKHDEEVHGLEQFESTGTHEEKKLVELLVKHGIKNHEKREDDYIKARIPSAK